MTPIEANVLDLSARVSHPEDPTQALPLATDPNEFAHKDVTSATVERISRYILTTGANPASPVSKFVVGLAGQGYLLCAAPARTGKLELPPLAPTEELPRGHVKATVEGGEVSLPVFGSLAWRLPGGTQEAVSRKAGGWPRTVGTVSGGHWAVRVSPDTMEGGAWVLFVGPGNRASILAKTLSAAQEGLDGVVAAMLAAESKPAAVTTPARGAKWQPDDSSDMTTVLNQHTPVGTSVCFSAYATLTKRGHGKWGEWGLLQIKPDDVETNDCRIASFVSLGKPRTLHIPQVCDGQTPLLLSGTVSKVESFAGRYTVQLKLTAVVARDGSTP